MIARLGDISEFINGGSWSDKEYTENGIPVVKVTNLKNGSVDLSEINYIPESSLDKYGRHMLRKGDLVIATVGSHPNLVASAAGRATIIPSKAEGALLNQNALCIRTNSDDLNQGYLGYLGKSDLFQGYVKSVGRGAANQVRIALGLIKEFLFELPPLPTQRKIASILSAYDDLIENNLKRIKLLEEKAQLHYAKYKPTEKFELQDKAEYLGRGVSPKYEEGSGFYAINQKANKGSMLDYNHFKELDTKLEVPNEKFAKWGDVLINSLGEGTLGRVHFYTDKSNLYAVDQHMSIFRTRDLHITFYFYQFLASDYGQGLIETLKKGGTNMTMLNISDLRQLEVSFPKEKDLKELWAIAEPMYKLKQTLTSQNTKLREARDILLPKLMNRQIEV